MSKVTGLSISLGLEEALMEMHNRSMSRDPVEACEGRMSKMLVNALDGWMTEEDRRNTQPADIVMATKSALLTTFFTLLSNKLPPDKVLIVAKKLRDPIIADYDRCIEMLQKQLEEPEKS